MVLLTVSLRPVQSIAFQIASFMAFAVEHHLFPITLDGRLLYYGQAITLALTPTLLNNPTDPTLTLTVVIYGNFTFCVVQNWYTYCRLLLPPAAD